MVWARHDCSRVLRVVGLLLLCVQFVSSVSAEYRRPGKSPDLPILSDGLRRSNSETRPEQIHISFAGPGAVSISWVTHAQDAAAVTATPHPSQTRQQQPASLWEWWGAAQTWLLSRRGVSLPASEQQQQRTKQQAQPQSHQQQNSLKSLWTSLQQGWYSSTEAFAQRSLTQHDLQHHHHHHHSSPAEPSCDHLSHIETATHVVYGTFPDLTRASNLTSGAVPAEGAFSANGSYTCYTSAEYESGALHSVILGQGPEGPLLPSTTYFYQVGDTGPNGQLSPVFSFNTTPPVGPQSLPYRLGLVGDLGQTLDSAKTLQHLVDVQPQSILNVGDLSYADGYQPRWDTYGRLVQPSTAHVAWMNIEGNHEQELVGSDEKSWLAYALRFSATDVSSGSGTTMYYSYDIAAAHVIMIGSYADFDADSAQYAWLQQDLQKVDRSRTPWLVVGMHVPWYNSYHSHHGEGDAIRESLEELLFQNGVDLIFTGHVHSYERSRRVFRGEPNPCGPIHVTIGDGGNREGAALGWEEPEPVWSEVREPSFGMGVLEFVDSTTAIWQWYRNSETPVKDTADEVVLVRDPTCQPPQLAKTVS